MGKVQKQGNWKLVLTELGKWALVIFLLLPLRGAQAGPIDLWRVALGILLFVIFGGKLLYDAIIADLLHRRRESTARDWVTLLGMVVVVAIVVGMMLLFSGWLLVKLAAQARSVG